jgi:hypothetical protein
LISSSLCFVSLIFFSADPSASSKSCMSKGEVATNVTSSGFRLR